MPRAIVSFVILSGVLSGCGWPLSPSTITVACTLGHERARRHALLQRPFAGDFPTGNLFDHDKPLAFNDSNGRLLTLCGYTTTDSGVVRPVCGDA